MRFASRWFTLAVGVAIGATVGASGCLDSTQVTFDITTDIPCDKISGTSITVGLEGQTEKAMPSATVKDCTADGNVRIIGTYAVRPRGNSDVVASLKVAVAVGTDVKVETACTPTNGYRDCVVARRRVSFLAHRSLTVPVEMLLLCKDVQCDESSSCNKAGRCVTSLIDTSKCDEQGTCSEIVTKSGDGLPCFNEGTGSGLFCRGDDSWCTRGPTGVKACAKAPVAGSVSYQCREARDCGPNLMCLAGSAGVLGRCAPMANPTDTVLCTLGEPVSPCVGGPRQCYADAGPGLFSCAPTDAGMIVNRTDAGLPCPRTGNLVCSGATPLCSVISGTPACVADVGAQCWYPRDCPGGTTCFAGVTAPIFNACLDAGTVSNPVPLCDDALDGGDCAPGFTCTGVFYGFRACQKIPDGGAIDAGPSDAGVDAGIDDAGLDAGFPDDGGTADAAVSDAGSADAGDGG